MSPLGSHPSLATMTVSSSLLSRYPGYLVAITGCTCAGVWMRRTAIHPPGVNFGGVKACLSTLELISACKIRRGRGC